MNTDFTENITEANSIQLKEIAKTINDASVDKPLNKVYSISYGGEKILFAKISNPNNNHKAYPAWLFSNTFKIAQVGYIYDDTIRRLEQFSLLSKDFIVVSLKNNTKILEKIIEANSNFNVSDFDSDGYKK